MEAGDSIISSDCNQICTCTAGGVVSCEPLCTSPNMVVCEAGQMVHNYKEKVANSACMCDRMKCVPKHTPSPNKPG